MVIIKIKPRLDRHQRREIRRNLTQFTAEKIRIYDGNDISGVACTHGSVSAYQMSQIWHATCELLNEIRHDH